MQIDLSIKIGQNVQPSYWLDDYGLPRTHPPHGAPLSKLFSRFPPGSVYSYVFLDMKPGMNCKKILGKRVYGHRTPRKVILASAMMHVIICIGWSRRNIGSCGRKAVLEKGSPLDKGRSICTPLCWLTFDLVMGKYADSYLSICPSVCKRVNSIQ